jgi:hypothetical protein
MHLRLFDDLLDGSLDRCAALASSLDCAFAGLHKLRRSWLRRHVRHRVFALNTTLPDFAAPTIWAVITNDHAFFTFFLGFFAVFAAALKAAVVGAPLAPTFLIFSPLPALMRARFLAILRYKRHQQYLPRTCFAPPDFFPPFFLPYPIANS